MQIQSPYKNNHNNFLYDLIISYFYPPHASIILLSIFNQLQKNIHKKTRSFSTSGFCFFSSTLFSSVV